MAAVLHFTRQPVRYWIVRQHEGADRWQGVLVSRLGEEPIVTEIGMRRLVLDVLHTGPHLGLPILPDIGPAAVVFSDRRRA